MCGAGGADMINMTVKVDPVTRARYKAMYREYPKIANRVWNGISITAKNRLASVVAMGGGKYGVQSWDDPARMTRALTWRTKSGGVLGEKNRIVRFRQGNAQIIGWPSKLDPYSEQFQQAEQRAFNPLEKSIIIKRLYARGVRPDTVKAIMAETYNRPARNTVSPFIINAQTWIAPEFKKRADRALAKELAK